VTAAVAWEDVSVDFDGKGPRVANVTLHAETGRVLALVGMNGAGKTTLLRVGCGALRPTTGRVLLDGEPVERTPPPDRCAALLEEPRFYPDASGLLNVRLFAAHAGQPKKRASELLARVGLPGESWERPVRQYSQGMRQRLGIARCLIADPQILFFDEPLNALDSEGVNWFVELLAEWKRAGRTTVVASHLLPPLVPVVDDVAFLSDGRLLEAGPIEQSPRWKALSAQHSDTDFDEP
jgi:ABC-2 type transport system ATP-binding protein